MRFVAKSFIALAAVLSWTEVGQGQSQLPTYTGAAPAAVASDSAPAPLRAGPVAPESIEGAWVSDKGQPAGPTMVPQGMGQPMPQGMYGQPAGYPPPGMYPGAQGQPGMGQPGGGQPFPGQPGPGPQNFGEAMAVPGSCSWEGDDPSCQPGDGCRRRRGGLCDLFSTNDFYTDTQSHRRIWVTPEYVQWFVKGNPLPPLATSSPPGTPQTTAGVLPESATTSILYGNDRVDTTQRPGGRLNIGYWLVDGEFLGIEGQYFALQQGVSTFHADSTQIPGGILARPFLDVNPILLTPQQGAALLGFPNFFLLGTPVNLTGTVDVRTTSSVQGAGALLRKLIWIDFTSQRRLDFLFGYRFFRFDDSVTINDVSNNSGGGFFAPSTTTSQDLFSARNQFHGGDIGLKFQQYCCGRFSGELIGKVAFGMNAEQVFITGSNTLTTLGTTVTNAGGLLTQASNMGLRTRDVFAILPEANANLRFDVTRNLRLTAGYSFIYINRAQRSGDAIDTTLNPTQINGGTLVGQSSPTFAFHDTSIWMHGINAGFEYRW